jgi:hypothetical protein
VHFAGLAASHGFGDGHNAALAPNCVCYMTSMTPPIPEPELPAAPTAAPADDTGAIREAEVAAAAPISESVEANADDGADDGTEAEAGVAPAKDSGAPDIDVAAELRKRFPALFGRQIKPLKLRIQADIQAAAPGVFTRPGLSAFLRRFTGGNGYLIALSKASHRYDLFGAEAGELLDEHRAAAVTELARRRELNAARITEQDKIARLRHAEAELLAQQRYNRSVLLYDFEHTTLTRGNFCVLKGVPVDELDGLIAQARQEAIEDAAKPRPPMQAPRHDGRPGGDGRDARGPRGPRPEGGRPPGDRPRGDRPPGDRPPGDRPRGDRSGGERPFADRPAGDRPAGDRPAGDRPRGDRPAGDRPPRDAAAPRGDRPAQAQGDRPPRPPGDRPLGDRPPRADGGPQGGERRDRGGRLQGPGPKPMGQGPRGPGGHGGGGPGGQPRRDAPRDRPSPAAVSAPVNEPASAPAADSSPVPEASRPDQV